MTTLLSTWSASDLVSLLAAKDYDFAQLEQHFAAFRPTWDLTDSGAATAWAADMAALQHRYNLAHSQATDFLVAAKLVPLPMTEITASGPYNAVLNALKQNPTTVTTGDYDDLDARLQVASGSATNYANQPQPTPGSDGDLNLLNALPNPGKPSTWPSWLKWTAGGVAVAAGLTVVSKVTELVKLVR